MLLLVLLAPLLWLRVALARPLAVVTLALLGTHLGYVGNWLELRYHLTSHARVLFLSGYTSDAVVRHGILHHEVAFLQKPFSAESLATKVRDVLRGDAG